jgi:curved DNA-binding protein CbpA
MNEKEKTYYEILGITPKADFKVMRQAYINLARRYHPDHNNNTDTSRMVELNKIYEVLSNPTKKKEYDQRFIQEQVYDFTRIHRVDDERDAKSKRIRKSIDASVFTKKVTGAGIYIALIVMIGLIVWIVFQIMKLYL